MTQAGPKQRRDYRALAHRLLFHWRDDALRMTAIEAELQNALELVARLEADVDVMRENNLRAVELIDIVEQHLTPKSLD